VVTSWPWSLIGGWDHAARLMLTAGAALATSDDAAWPPAARHAQPASWAAAYFGAPPAGPNRNPQADAGLATTYHPNGPLTIYLDGTNSADPDGQTLNYAWSQLAGPQVTLSDPAVATPSFNVEPVSAPTVLRFQLTVSDGQASSSPDEVEITLLPARPSMGDRHNLYLPLVVK